MSGSVATSSDNHAALHGETSPLAPLLALHGLLRGRYQTLIPCALAAALACGLAAYMLVKPAYTSTGMIRVAPVLPKVLFSNEQNSVTPNFDSYVAAQIALMKSRPLLDRAMQDPELSKAGWPAGEQGLAVLEQNLSVTARRGDEVITTTLTHANPRLARAAVDAVMNASIALRGEELARTAEQTERSLLARGADLEEQLHALEDQMIAEAAPLGGAEAIARAYDDSLRRLEEIDRGMKGMPAAPTSQSIDPITAGLLQNEASLAVEIDTLRAKYNDRHPRLVELQRRLDVVRDHIAQRRQGGLELPAADDGQTVLASLAQHREQTIAASAELGKKRLALATLAERAQALKQRLAENARRLEELRVESNRAISERFSIIAPADLPVRPTQNRRAAATILAFLGGTIGCVLAFAAAGLMGGRCRNPEQALACLGPVRILDVLPDLSNASAELRARAAQTIHRLRHALHVDSVRHDASIYAITGVDAAEDAADVALGIASSMARAGCRTLLIDACAGPRALTHALELEDQSGLLESMSAPGGDDLPLCEIARNLWALPAGRVDVHGHDLQPALFSRLLERLDEKFDRVLIACGSVSEDIAAMLAASTADRCLLVVPANAGKRAIESCVANLLQGGAACVGCVYTRAPREDFERRAGLTAQAPAAERPAPAAPLFSHGRAPALTLASTVRGPGSKRWKAAA